MTYRAVTRTRTRPAIRHGPAAQLRPHDVEEVERAFVDPDDLDELCRRARDPRVVILQGDRESGRFAARAAPASSADVLTALNGR